MRELLIATTNKGKLREIRELFKDLDFKITSLADYPGLPEIIEDGKTFRSNAVKKAVTIAEYTGKITIGEDSGLEVKALGNQPGIYSARFAGAIRVNAQDKKNNAKVLRLLRGVPRGKRQARYRCVAALVLYPAVAGVNPRASSGRGLRGTGTRGRVIHVVSGSCQGLIAEGSRGKNGFGYDPLFLIPKYNKTFGQLDPGIKAGISHRTRAFKKMRKFLEDYD